MAATTEVVCPMCGFKNPANAARCASCGARVESLSSTDLTEEELHARRHQQEGFEWKWVAVSFAIYMVLQAIVLVALPMVIYQYDPQGAPGLLISAGVWFVGGIVVGWVSPGKTFLEPAVGALAAAVPTIAYLLHISEVQPLSLLAGIIGGLLGVMITLFGAFLGEKIQGGSRGHATR